ncbi:hypothetical protein QR680_001852 [Steinernema hermaphroditum]|uniref:Chondroitin proteoglycan 4 domain-containing protein n=1 Tax=Steinernema hermaphroditum TaxID=289476 RepID=A0AA39LH13_9BILA|nr:hypothetical protein QR680_001852 [Steinernema hermaphroditum]
MSHPVMSLQFFVFSTLCLFVIRSHAKCEIKDVMGCVVHMKSRNVIIDADIMKIVYNVSSEAKLLHMCRTYNDVLACLRQKTSMCADEDLRVKLTEVSRLLLFLCSPFSLKNQKTLLEVAPCTKKVLQTPLSLPNCTNHDFSSKLTICRKKCKSNSVDCQSQVQMSELAVCSVVSIENNDILQSGKQMAKVLATKLDEFAENGHAYIESITGSRQQSDVEEKNIVPKQALNELFSAIASLSQSMRQQQHTNGSSIA